MIPVETKSSEKGLDLCKWTETWASQGRVLEVMKNAAVADEISWFQSRPHLKAQVDWNDNCIPWACDSTCACTYHNYILKVDSSSYLLFKVSLEYSPKHQMAVFKTIESKLEMIWVTGWRFSCKQFGLRVFIPTWPLIFFLGGLLVSFWKYFPYLFNIVCTAVILSCTYLLANWFPVSSNPVPQRSHWLWHGFDPRRRTDTCTLQRAE